VWNNVQLAVVVPLVTVVLSFALATMVTVGGASHGRVRGLRGSGFYRVISFFPVHRPGDHHRPHLGADVRPVERLLNGLLTGIGLERFDSFPWLGDTTTAMPASMFVIIWGFVGFYMVLFVAAIKGIPSEFYDAARMDGAGRFRMAWSITIPLIRDTVQTAYIYLGILALDAFVYMAALNPGGGPDNSTLVMPQRLLDTAFAKGPVRAGQRDGRRDGDRDARLRAIVFTVNRFVGGDDKGRASMTTDIRDDRETTTKQGPGTPARRRQGRGERLARRAQLLEPARHHPAAVDPAVVVQDEQGDLRVAVQAAHGLELRQLRLRVDDPGHRALLPQHGDRGRLRPRHRDDPRLDVRVRARLLLVPRAQVHLLLDARRV
jgi:N-acetylglucosamine transport system permease protein